jgi:hypothetical protein
MRTDRQYPRGVLYRYIIYVKHAEGEGNDRAFHSDDSDATTIELAVTVPDRSRHV